MIELVFLIKLHDEMARPYSRRQHCMAERVLTRLFGSFTVGASPAYGGWRSPNGEVTTDLSWRYAVPLRSLLDASLVRTFIAFALEHYKVQEMVIFWGGRIETIRPDDLVLHDSVEAVELLNGATLGRPDVLDA